MTDKDMPTFITRAREMEAYIEAHVPSVVVARLHEWFWPVFSWLLLVFNVAIMLMVVRDMWSGKYDALAHGLAVLVITGMFVFLALTHRLVLQPKPLLSAPPPLPDTGKPVA